MFKRIEPEVAIKLNDSLEKYMDDYNKDKYYSNSQRMVINYLLMNIFSKKKNWYYIIGNACTGKSFLLRQLVRLFEEVLNLNVLVWASTGTAAKNINGWTVHKAFMINQNNVSMMWMPGAYAFKSLKKRDVIIIDEISMINEEMITLIDLTLRATQMENISNSKAWIRPFDGKMVILFGDLLQIPWVQEQKIGNILEKFGQYIRAIHLQIFNGYFNMIRWDRLQIWNIVMHATN